MNGCQEWAVDAGRIAQQDRGTVTRFLLFGDCEGLQRRQHIPLFVS